mmetsp:Transcript_11802/g.45727  ORF Transcript_11802/g.45727 Transcript_11802/m.45727 type:complete len:98 (-) Transcript_11802:130-423(-)
MVPCSLTSQKRIEDIRDLVVSKIQRGTRIGCPKVQVSHARILPEIANHQSAHRTKKIEGATMYKLASGKLACSRIKCNMQVNEVCIFYFYDHTLAAE